MASQQLSGAADCFCPFDTLPPPLFRQILLALPVDARARCAAVRRSWRALLADTSLWQVLDLSLAGGLAPHRARSPALIQGAAACATGQLRALTCFEHGVMMYEAPVRGALFAVVAVNGATLRELNFDKGPLLTMYLRHLLAAAPRLQALNAYVNGLDAEQLLAVLRNEPPFAPLRVCGLICKPAGAGHAWLQVAAAAATHPELRELSVYHNARHDPAVPRRLSTRLTPVASLRLSLRAAASTARICPRWRACCSAVR